MEKLSKIYPLIMHIFTLGEGISSSAASAIKIENTANIKQLLRKLESPIYITKREVISGDYREPTYSKLEYPIAPSDFDAVKDIAIGNSISAWLGFAIKYKDSIIKELNTISNEDLAKKLGIEVPIFLTRRPATPKMAINWGGLIVTASQRLQHFCETIRAEDLVGMCSKELLDSLPVDLIHNILATEAAASAYGKRLHNNAFLRTLMDAEPTQLSKDTVAGDTILVRTKILAYNKEDFEDTVKELTAKYSEFQEQRNGYFKIMKDAARKLQQVYNVEFTEKSSEYNKLNAKYQDDLKVFNAELTSLRGDLISEAAAMKI